MHSALYQKIGDELTKVDFERLKQGIPLTPRDKERSGERAEDLLHMWENRGGISPGNYDQLLQLLLDVDLVKIHHLVKEQIAERDEDRRHKIEFPVDRPVTQTEAEAEPLRNVLKGKGKGKAQKRSQSSLSYEQHEDETVVKSSPAPKSVRVSTSTFPVPHGSTAMPVHWPNVDANPLHVKVRKCADDDATMNEYFNNADGVYSMKGRIKGVRVLIINNKTFTEKTRDTNKSLQERVGTNVDAESLELLFKQLGYKRVKTLTDLTGQGIKKALKNEATCTCQECRPIYTRSGIPKMNCKKEDNAFICVILSHGTNGAVYGVDGEPIKLEDIWNQFNGQKCPTLVGKPKIFFLQICQGDIKDTPGAYQTIDSVMELSEQLAGLTIGKEETDAALAIPTMADILVSISTTEGYVSWSNSLKGSWFIQALVEVIKNDAYKLDLQQILRKVKLLLASRQTTQGEKQSYFTRDTFRKQFYFFPGFEEGALCNTETI